MNIQIMIKNENRSYNNLYNSGANLKKVALFSPGLYPCETGGMEIFYYHLLRSINKRTSLLVFTCCKKIICEKIKFVKLNRRLFLFKRLGLGKMSLLISSFQKILVHRNKINVIHIAYTSDGGFYGYLFPSVKRLFKIPYILVVHGGGMREWRRLSGNRMLFRAADKIVAVSEVIRNEYEKRCQGKIDLIYPLVPFYKSASEKNILKNKLGFNTNDYIILVVGSIKPLKGSDIIIRAFMDIDRETIDRFFLKLVFVGDGPLLPELKKISKSHPDKNEAICFLGNVSNEKIADYYQLADMYVIASWYEGTPKSLLEAMYNGLPIIGSDVNGINNIISNRKNGLLFEKNNYSELKNKMLFLVKNKDNARELGKNAESDYKLNYSFSRTIDSFNEIYDCYRKETL